MKLMDRLSVPDPRTRQVARVLAVTLVLNWTVSLSKVVYGMLTQCMVIVADGVHSFADGTSNIIGLVAIFIAARPADEGHPYGHQKYETLASAVIAFFLFAAASEIVRKAVSSFVHPMHPEVTPASFAVMGVTLAVNIFVVLYERRHARRLKSDFLMSDSWHTLTDIFVTLAVLAALAGIRSGIPNLDAFFSLGIAVVVIVTAIGILKRSSDVLCDRAVLDKEQIKKLAESITGVVDCHEIRTRGREDSVYVDLHVLVDPHKTVAESHRLSHLIEKKIRTELSGVVDVVVHIEPSTHDHEDPL